jgi:hypothetical protein
MKTRVMTNKEPVNTKLIHLVGKKTLISSPSLFTHLACIQPIASFANFP